MDLPPPPLYHLWGSKRERTLYRKRLWKKFVRIHFIKFVQWHTYWNISIFFSPVCVCVCFIGNTKTRMCNSIICQGPLSTPSLWKTSLSTPPQTRKLFKLESPLYAWSLQFLRSLSSCPLFPLALSLSLLISVYSFSPSLSFSHTQAR